MAYWSRVVLKISFWVCLSLKKKVLMQEDHSNIFIYIIFVYVAVFFFQPCSCTSVEYIVVLIVLLPNYHMIGKLHDFYLQDNIFRIISFSTFLRFSSITFHLILQKYTTKKDDGCLFTNISCAIKPHRPTQHKHNKTFQITLMTVTLHGTTNTRISAMMFWEQTFFACFSQHWAWLLC